MKNIHEKFSSIDLLHHLFTKISFLFKPQQFIIQVLKDTMKRSRMVGVLGREGMGKSTAIAKFIQDNSHVYYLRIGTTYNLSNFFNEMLYQVSGVYPTTGDTLFNKMKTLSYLLTKDNNKKLIIVDDAGRLNPRALSVFFELRDNTIHTTGFVFVGLDYFQNNLLKAKKKGVPGIAEFYRRVENWFTVPGLSQNEIGAYGLKNKLSEDQVLVLKELGTETIAELENMTQAILEDSQAAAKEERGVSKHELAKKRLSDNTRTPASSKQGRTKSKDNENDSAEEAEDELEEGLAQKKKEAAARARAARTAQNKTQKKAKTESYYDPNQ